LFETLVFERNTRAELENDNLFITKANTLSQDIHYSLYTKYNLRQK